MSRPRPHRRALPLLLLAALVATLGAALPGAAPAAARPVPPGAPGAAGPVSIAPDWWSARGELDSPPPGDPRVAPARSFAFALDKSAASTALGLAADGRRLVVLPDPDGDLVAFRIEPVAVMEAELAAAHPEIETYAGRAVADPSQTIRVDLTPTGLHASVRRLAAGGSWYVDPAYQGRNSVRHLSYRAADLPADAEVFVERGPERLAPEIKGVDDVPRATARTAPGDVVVQRVYRLAMLNDPSYAQFFGSANVLAEKVTLLQRVDQIYREDLGISLRLVDDTDRLNLDTTAKATGSGGPCGPSACFTTSELAFCSSALLGANQDAVDAIIGSSAYDVGHIVLGKNGGGLASLGVVGRAGLKARGCTGVPSPVGDAFYVDYVAHEIGHQYDGEHTFNGTQSACSSGNREATTSVEPGSGSSVMAYAGICGSDDLQPHTDPYFSQRTIDQVTAYVTAAPAQGGTTSASDNHAPAVSAPADRDLPVLTPFTLRATGSDVDGDELTYLWEQNDRGGTTGTALTSAVKDRGPLFRVFGDNAQVSPADAEQSPSPGQNQADGSPSRTFPDLAQVLAGHTNAATGDCPAALADDARLDCFSEFLPTVDYVNASEPMTFRVTARDGAVTGGTQYDDVDLRVDRTAGPLRVTSQAGAGSVEGGTAGTVTWSVNGTNKASLAPMVRILLSDDGGATWTHVLASSTANDGSHSVLWPDLATTEARVKVEAVDNYFFAVNDLPFAITSDTTLTVRAVAGAERTVQYSDPLVPDLLVEATSTDTDGGDLEATATLPDAFELNRVSSSEPGERPGVARFAVTGVAEQGAGSYPISVEVSEPAGPDADAAEVAGTVTVVPERAVPVYTGETDVTAPTEGATTVDVALRSHVTQDLDGHPGDLRLAELVFVDRDTGSELCEATLAVSGDAVVGTCTAALAVGGAPVVHTVGTVIRGPFYGRDQAGDDASVTTRPLLPPDTDPPLTRITSGPAHRGFVLRPRVTFGFAADEPATYRCSLDGYDLACSGSSVRLGPVQPGTHTVTVAATDEAGNEDTTPAVRRWARPLDADTFTRSSAWSRRYSRAAYLRSFVLARQRGATLKKRVDDVERVAVVVTTGPGDGRISVSLGGKRLGTKSLRSATTRTKQVMRFPRLLVPRSGKLVVRTLNGRRVRIEGIGVLTR